jgi:hypothetical protein
MWDGNRVNIVHAAADAMHQHQDNSTPRNSANAPAVHDEHAGEVAEPRLPHGVQVGAQQVVVGPGLQMDYKFKTSGKIAIKDTDLGDLGSQ